MDLSAEAIVEEIIDPLMVGDLAKDHPAMMCERLARNTVRVDFGVPDEVYVLSVERHPRP